MEIRELLEQHRSHYIKYFLEVSKDCNGDCEVLVDQKNDEPDELYRLYRMDCIEKNEDGTFNIIEYNNDAFLNHSPISFSGNDVNIEICPIFWNGVEIGITGFDGEFTEVTSWARKWIDIEDSNSRETPEGFTGAIHNFYKPETHEEKIYLSIDFGTAGIVAITELIDILLENNVKNIRIHSDTLLSDD